MLKQTETMGRGKEGTLQLKQLTIDELNFFVIKIP